MKTSYALIPKLVALAVISLSSAAWSQQPSVSVQFPGSPVNDVLELYGELTGKRILKDPALETTVVTVDTAGELTHDKAIEFIEKQLLLYGLAIVPSGDDMVKVIQSAPGKLPGTEGVEMVLRESELPKSDKVVSYVLPLQFLKSEDAAQSFAQIITPHAYGRLMPVPNAKAVVITENSSTIRAYIELAKRVDLSPTETVTRSIQLERADAEEVAVALSSLLGLDQPSTSRPPGAAAAKARPAGDGQPAAATSVVYASAQAESSPPKITPIARRNSLLVIARPVDVAYIETLVKEFDAESPSRSFISRKVKFMDLTDFVELARNALLRGAPDKTGNVANASANTQTTSNTTRPVTTANSSFGGSGYGSGGLGSNGLGSGLGGGLGGGMGSSFGSSGVGLQDTQLPKSQSLLIGKTLVIVDPPNSTFYASGPPEQLRVLTELLDQMDKRPPQIRLSAIIGEFTIGNDFQFGLDWIRTLQSVGNNNIAGGILKTSQGSANPLTDINALGGVKDFISAPLQGFTAYAQIGKHLNVFLNTLESSKRFHVLQRPYVTTMNHKKATISTGQQLAIPGQSYASGTTTGSTGTTTGSAGNGFVTTTQYIPAELKLEIVPHIYDNHELKLEFVQQNLDVASYTTISGNQVPNLSTQSLQNTLVVPDGATIILGGLITERNTRNKTGLPILSRIPILKSIFGSTSDSKERRELMIFVQPTIMTDGDDLEQKQMDIARTNQSYPANKQFAEPNPILPLPAWDQGKPIPRAVSITEEKTTNSGPARDINTKKPNLYKP